MIIAYIAHPVSGDVRVNLEKVMSIAFEINFFELDVVPFAPYFFSCHVLNDAIKEHRARGIKNNIAFFEKGFIDELRLYGDRISPGMLEEVKLARRLKIPIKAMTKETKKEYFDFLHKK